MYPWRNLFSPRKRGLSYLPDPFYFFFPPGQYRTEELFSRKFIELIFFSPLDRLLRTLSTDFDYSSAVTPYFVQVSFFASCFMCDRSAFISNFVWMGNFCCRSFPFCSTIHAGQYSLRSKKLFIMLFLFLLFCFLFFRPSTAAAAAAPSRTFLTSF